MLIPELPHDVALECLCRLHFSVYPLASSVCPQWRDLLHRKKSGHTHNLACLIQALPPQGLKPAYGITVFDPLTRLPPLPDFPLFCQIATSTCSSSSSRGKLVLMGGWHPLTYEPLAGGFDSEVRVGVCVLTLGSTTMVIGSDFGVPRGPTWVLLAGRAQS